MGKTDRNDRMLCGEKICGRDRTHQKEIIHGGDIYRNEAELDFSVNVNPLGMPEESKKAAWEGILSSGAYPDTEGEKLRRKIAGQENLSMKQVVLGNGAAELIYAICYALNVKKGLVTAPSFAEYERAVLAAGGKIQYFRLFEDQDFRLSEEILKEITDDCDILFLCNPNNPTGTFIKRELLEKTAERCEETKTYFCLDECFLPFMEEEGKYTMKGMLARFPHLVILRAFTKIYAMAGLRLGYALCSNVSMAEAIREKLQPWNTSIPAQMAGVAALEDEDYLKRTRKLMDEEKAYLLKELPKWGADRIYGHGANFIFFHGREDLGELLLKKKILIRDCSNFPGLSGGFYRIGIGCHEENEALIRCMRQIQEETQWQNPS